MCRIQVEYKEKQRTPTRVDPWRVGMRTAFVGNTGFFFVVAKIVASLLTCKKIGLSF